jgi:hypothetical protein
MSKKFRQFSALVFVLSAVLAVATSAAAQKLPPLIDREIFFGNPEIAGASISPDGKFMPFENRTKIR